MKIEKGIKEAQDMSDEDIKKLATAIAPIVKAVIIEILYNNQPSTTHSAQAFQNGYESNLYRQNCTCFLQKFFDNCHRRHR